MFRWLARTLAVAALAPLALPAHAVADESFTTTGSITYTWHGDPARGCAAEGLCGVKGALILQPEGSVGVSGGGPTRGLIPVPLAPSTATVRVSDGPGAGACVDEPSGLDGGGALVIRRGAGGRQVGRIESSLSSGRCAGPLASDLAAVAIPVTRSGGSFDLRASESFAAGPFTGTLVSTLVVRTGSGGGGSGSVSSGPAPVARPVPTHKVLIEQVALRYRIASLPGTLDASFSGEPDPFCAALDSCGATGSIALSLPRYRSTVFVSASRVVTQRVDADQAVADFRRGLLHAGGGGIGPPGADTTARVAETFDGSGGWRCQDSVVSRGPQLFPAVRPRSGAGIAFGIDGSLGPDLLRTHCPGPSFVDVFGHSRAVVRASIGAARLLAHHSVISMTSPGSFSGFGYVGTRAGALRFSLTLERVRAGTVVEERP